MNLKKLYANPILYENEYKHIIDDLDFWKNIIMEYNPRKLLELGCGAGRVAKSIYSLLSLYVGLDNSKEFLQLFRDSQKNILRNNNYLVEGDMRGFCINESFDMIIIPFNTISHIYNNQDFKKLCSSIKKHLNPDGIFAIDCFNPDFQYMLDVSDEYIINNFTLDNDEIIVYEKHKYDRKSQINMITRRYHYKHKEEDVILDLPMKIYYPNELNSLFELNDLKIIEKYGDYDFSSYSSKSPKQIILLKERKSL